MANQVITGVKLITKASPISIILGETCVAFDIVQKVGQKYMLSVATDAGLGAPTHIILQGGVDNGYVVALPLNGQSYDLGGVTLVQSAQYVQSATPGKIAERADLTSGQLLTDIFKASTAAIADFQIETTGIAEP